MMCSVAAAALREGDANDNALTVSVELVSVIRRETTCEMMCSRVAAALQEGDANDNALTVSVELVSVIRRETSYEMMCWSN